jgi:hypothetical protein
MKDPQTTPAKLARRIIDLEEAAGAKAEYYTAPAPRVETNTGEQLPALQRHLIDAVWAAHPADLHVLINPFKTEPDIIIDPVAQTATVVFNREAMTLRNDDDNAALTAYWVESGHLL